MDEVLLSAQELNKDVLHRIQRCLVISEHKATSAVHHGSVLAVVSFNVDRHALFPLPILVFTLTATPVEHSGVTQCSYSDQKKRNSYTRREATPTDQSTDTIDSMNTRALRLVQRSPAEAHDVAHEALMLSYQQSYEAGAAEAHLMCGWAHVFLGRFESAIPHLIEASDRFRMLGDDNGAMRSGNALGTLLVRIAEYEEAIDEFRRVLALARETGNREREVAALLNLGETYTYLKEYATSERMLRDALRIGSDLGPDMTGMLRANLGRVLTETGKFESATGELEAALRDSEEIDDRITKAEVLLSLGRNLSGRYAAEHAEEALELINESLRLSEESEHLVGVSSALETLALLAVETGELAEAESLLTRLNQLSVASDIRPQWIGLVDRLVAAYTDSNDEGSALRVARFVLDAYARSSNDDEARRIRAARARHELERVNLQATVERLAHEEVRRTNQKLELMHAIGAELTATLDLEELAQLLHDRVNEFLAADVFGIALLSEDGSALNYDFFIEDNQRLTPVSVRIDNTNSFGSWVVRERSDLIMRDADREYQRYVKQRLLFTAHRSRTIVYMPLLLERSLVGIITVQAFEKDAYDEDALDLLRLLVPSVAIAVANSRKVSTISNLNDELVKEKNELEEAYRRIAHMANHDILTQLPNRRLVVELINEYIPHARRQSRQFGLLYVDLDDFKPVNDTFGHDAGDRVLQITAERLRKVVRESDTVARLGGDEFVLIVRDATDMDDVIGVADKVASAVRERIDLGSGTCELSASVGVSLFPDDGDSYEDLLRAADRAMYNAKQAGKSRISISRPNKRQEARAASEDRSDSTLDQSIASSSNTNQPSTE